MQKPVKAPELSAGIHASTAAKREMRDASCAKAELIRREVEGGF
jgi:hypothetical protein